MNTITTPENDDYRRGFRDGVRYMNDMEDEAAVMELLFGARKLEDMSPKQLQRLSPDQIARLKEDGK